jgi:hypothetical protein
MSQPGRIGVAAGLVALSLMSGCRADGDPVAPSWPSSVAADRAARLGTPATTLTFPFHEPIAFSDFTECVNGGLGEVIDWSGEISGVSHLTTNLGDCPFCGFHVVNTTSFHLLGVGQTTGNDYRLDVVANFSFASPDDENLFPLTATQVNTLRVIEPGAGVEFFLVNNFKLTVNANDEVIVDASDFATECR